jgi:hypothetical protein
MSRQTVGRRLAVVGLSLSTLCQVDRKDKPRARGGLAATRFLRVERDYIDA